MLNHLPDPTLSNPKAEPCCVAPRFGSSVGKAAQLPHSKTHTGLGQLWPFQKQPCQEQSISEPTKENTGEEGEQTGPQARPLEGRQAAAEPVRHQVKYSLKTSISISYINIPVQTGSQAGEREGKRVPQQHTDGQERWAGGQWGGRGMWGEKRGEQEKQSCSREQPLRCRPSREGSICFSSWGWCGVTR